MKLYKKLSAVLLSTAIASLTITVTQGSVSAASSNLAAQTSQNNSIKIIQSQNGWVQQNSKWYYYNNNGQKNTGWLLTNGKWYFLNSGGDMHTGWLFNNNNWYYFSNSGDMYKSSWVSYNNKWYYVNSSGDMASNTTTPDGYKVGTDGAWLGYSATANTPKNIAAETLSSSSINVTWNTVDDADYYCIYYKEGEDTTFKSVKTTSNSYTLTSLTSDTVVYFKVTAVVDSIESSYSNTVYAATSEASTIDISAPDNVEAEALSSSSIKVTWDAVDAADYYYVYYKKSGSSTFTTVKKTTDYFTLTGLDSDTLVYFKVKAVSGSILSDYSSTVSAATDEADSIVSAPDNVDAEALSSSSIKVTWDAVDDADYYYVYYKKSGSTSFKAVKKTSAYFTLTGLDSDTLVYFKVKAVSGSEVSDYSSTVSATTESD